jgi:hypothetical protein
MEKRRVKQKDVNMLFLRYFFESFSKCSSVAAGLAG